VTCSSFIGVGPNRRPCSRHPKEGTKCWQHTTAGSERSGSTTAGSERSAEKNATGSVAKTEKSTLDLDDLPDLPIKKKHVKRAKPLEVIFTLETDTKRKKPNENKAIVCSAEKSKKSPKKCSEEAKVTSVTEEYCPFEESLLEYFGDYESYNALQQKVLAVDIALKECPHKECIEDEEEGIRVCKECGCQVENLDFKPEWHFYGASDNRPNRDGSRCHRSKETQKGTIEKVFQDAKLEHLPLSIKKKTETRYRIIVGDETVRGKGRKAIVAACLLYVYRHEGDIRTADDIRINFGLSKQEMSDGLTRYHEAFPEDRAKKVSPHDLIYTILKKLKMDLSHYGKIYKIAKVVDHRDITLNRSCPHAVAAAIVYLYLCLNPSLKESLGLTKTVFSKAVKLSDITISKLAKRSACVLAMDDLIE
jgi:transcription initiation factor TFIIIB Brf1 subunit/transcription initiation factor TFIIB